MSDFEQRIRDRSTMSTPYTGHYWEFFCDGSKRTDNTWTITYLTRGTTQTMTDWVTPGYQRKSRSGAVFNKPLHSVKTEEDCSVNSNFTITYNPTCTYPTIKSMSGTNYIRGLTSSSSFGSVPGASAYVESVCQNLRTSVGTSAAGGVQKPDIQGLVSVAELDKTYKTLRHPLSNFNQLITDIGNSKQFSKFRKKFGKTASLSRFIANNWLQYRYGILPIMSDIENIIKVGTTQKYSPRHTSRARDSDYTEYQTTIPYSETYFNGSTVKKSRIDIEVRCGYLYEHAFSLSDRIGYNLADIPAAAWELIPYSFVVDWFINVGDFLNAITPRIESNVLAKWTTTRVVYTDTVHGHADPATVANYTVAGSLDFTRSRVITDVVRLPTVDVGLVVNLKNLGFSGYQLNRTLSAIALIVQKLR